MPTSVTEARISEVAAQCRDERATVVTFAKDQPEYNPLPAVAFPDGKVLTEWALSDDERRAIAAGGALRLWVWRFDRPLQPVALQVVAADGTLVE